MTAMSGVVQFALVKSLAIWGDIKIYAGTIGFVVTFFVAMLWFVRLLFSKKKLLGKRS